MPSHQLKGPELRVHSIHESWAPFQIWERASECYIQLWASSEMSVGAL